MSLKEVRKDFLPQDRSAQLAQVKACSLALVFLSLFPGKTTKCSHVLKLKW